MFIKKGLVDSVGRRSDQEVVSCHIAYAEDSVIVWRSAFKSLVHFVTPFIIFLDRNYKTIDITSVIEQDFGRILPELIYIFLA